jgi:CDP-diacylglycerol--glycerol-3-phosphate 3-phosphatidyltransferase
MTTANKITVLRILLVPFFISLLLIYGKSGDELHRWLALACFGIAAALDGVDGYIARRFHQKSELGAVLDPLADKLLLVSALILLGLEHHRLTPLPVWVNLTVISRDVLLVLGLGVIHFTVGSVRVRPRWTGKCATVLQMALVLWCLLKWPPAIQTYLALAATVLTAISGSQYLWDGIRQLSASPRSGPSPGQGPR